MDKEISNLGVEALKFWKLPKVKNALDSIFRNGSSMIAKLTLK